MSKKVHGRRSFDFYRLALKGFADKKTGERTLGLRDVSNKYAASSRAIGKGYNLNEFADWSAADKARITREHHVLQDLTAQPRRVYKPVKRTKAALENLEKAKRVLQHDKGKDWKVALIPGVPRFYKSGKEKPPVLAFRKGAVVLQDKGYKRIVLEIDRPALARNTRKEVKRLLSIAPSATRFRIQADENEIVIGAMYDRVNIVEGVEYYMNKYDGVTALPSSSGNNHHGVSPDPKHHKWSEWMSGIVAYEFPRTTAKAVSKAVTEFDDARVALQKKRRAYRAQLARKG